MSIPAAMNPSFDPGAAVPEEYDLLCEGCGYSLIGLGGDRCPECGKVFEPAQLPYARIPWLHRRRIGRLRAYWRTVGMVLFRPARFVSELRRPVRISADDARRFRSLTIWLATILVAMVVMSFLVVTVLAQGFGPRSLAWTRVWWWFVFKTLALEFTEGLIPLAAFHILLRAATDMPLFIWKGVPSLPPTQLSPVHHYASAPLAVVAVMVPLIWAMGPLLVGNFLQQRSGATATGFYLMGLLLVWMLWTWIISLKMMRAAGGATRRQVVLLGLYLPVHWLMMGGAFVMAMIVYGVYADMIFKPLQRLLW